MFSLLVCAYAMAETNKAANTTVCFMIEILSVKRYNIKKEHSKNECSQLFGIINSAIRRPCHGTVCISYRYRMGRDHFFLF